MRGSLEFPPFSLKSDGGIQVERKSIKAWRDFLPLHFFLSLGSFFPREKSAAALFQPGVVLIGFCLKYLRDGNIKGRAALPLSGLDR